jgi:hypothetical protein
MTELSGPRRFDAITDLPGLRGLRGKPRDSLRTTMAAAHRRPPIHTTQGEEP